MTVKRLIGFNSVDQFYPRQNLNCVNREYLVSVFCYQVNQARLQEHLLPSDSTCVLEAELGKLDIKRCVNQLAK